MDNYVTLTHRNVCKEGFTVADTVDAGAFALTSTPLHPSALFRP